MWLECRDFASCQNAHLSSTCADMKLSVLALFLVSALAKLREGDCEGVQPARALLLFVSVFLMGILVPSCRACAVTYIPN
jgi:hypothetical protein